jgi:DNA-binding GntR family transcriptional regulator
MSIDTLVLPNDARRLDNEPLSNQVYNVLRDAICVGSIQAHDHLVQNQLAEQLQVSRTPVRDALLRLAQEGLVKAVSARGFVVEPLTPHDILEVYELRRLLEVPVAAAAVPLLRAVDIAHLKDLNLEITTAPQDGWKAYDLNRQFHSRLIETSPNRLVRSTLSDLWDLPIARRIFHQQVAKGFDAEEMAHGHVEIIAAVEARDAEALTAALLAHLVEAREEASKLIEMATSSDSWARCALKLDH